MVDLVLIDENDNPIGVKEKMAAHLGDGDLHRAFTILVFNDKGETLVAMRSAEKMLWPLFWDNACASHPLENEGYEAAGERRLSEELGFTCKLEIADRFQYKEKYLDVGSENEVCTTLIGKYDGEVQPVPAEVAEIKWMSVKDLKDDMTKNPDIYTIWFKIVLDRLLEQGKIKIGDE